MRPQFSALLLIAPAMFVSSACLAQPSPPISLKIDSASLPRLGSIDERFQSYNIEMVEVTGGNFWKPYASTAPADLPGGGQPTGTPASLYAYRPPIDLTNSRLRKLAAALGPAYLRVSGTWANTTWFQTADGLAPSAPPAGFKSVLTRDEWKGVIDFANAVDAKIVTSFAVSAGARDAGGVWTPDQARALLEFTKSSGGSIAAAEFMNEPTLPEIGGAPKGYDAAAYARDFTVFRPFMKHESPHTVILGPGGIGEGGSLFPPSMKILSSEAILNATGPAFDAFSYHFYGAVSSRCGRPGSPASTTAADALSADWLDRTDKSEEFYAGLRDRFLPRRPIWLTETAEAACGGDRWASTFLDSFRYLNQLGTLARRGVQVHMHNTLSASDYALLNEKTYEPRPNYWAALLWHKLMGTTVLDVGASSSASLRVYAHCLPGVRGGVSMLAINTDKDNTQSIELTSASQRYTLTAHALEDQQVLLNGVELKLGENSALPSLNSAEIPAGRVSLPPLSITFLAVARANNANCRR